MFFEPDISPIHLPGKIAAPELLIPNRKPIGPVEIDWAHPLTKGLIRCYVPTASNCTLAPSATGMIQNLATGEIHKLDVVGSTEDGIYYGKNQYGEGIVVADSSQTCRVPTIGAQDVGTLMIAASQVTTSFGNRSYFSHSDYNHQIFLEKENANDYLHIALGTASSTSTVSIPNTDEMHVLAMSWGDTQTDSRGYINGDKVITFDRGTDQPGSASDVTNWGRPGGTLQHTSHVVYFWNRQLSDAEVAALSADPYQILKPVGSAKRLYVGPSVEPIKHLPAKATAPEHWIPNRKPTGPVEIDWSNPLTKGLSHYILFQNTAPHDLVTGKALTVGNAPGWNREGAYFDEYADTLVDYYLLPDVTLNNEFTFLTHPNFDDNDGTGFQYWLSYGAIPGTGAFHAMLVESSTSTADQLKLLGNSGAAETIIPDIAGWWPTYNNRPLAIAINGTTPHMYVDGIDRVRAGDTFGTSAMPNGTADDLYIGARSDLATDRAMGGSIRYLMIFNDKELSQSEVAELQRDPYQILKPVSRYELPQEILTEGITLPEPRFEAPALLIPNRKPVGPVTIDWTHPLAQGIVCFWLGDQGSIDLTGNCYRVAWGGDAHIDVSKEGRIFRFDGTGDYFRYTQPPKISSGKYFTRSAFINSPETTTQDVLSDLSDAVVLRTFSTSNYRGIIKLSDGYHTVDGTTAPVANKTVFASLRYKDSEIAIAVNGKVEGTLAVTSGLSNTLGASDVLLGIHQGLSGNPYNGDVWCEIWHDRPLSDAELYELACNPYQILVPA